MNQSSSQDAAKRAHNSNKGRTLLGRRHTLESLMARVRIDPQSGCWEWMGSRNEDGYGRVGWLGQVKRVHRVVYELVRGPIDAETLDHVCRNRGCVNPDHLRALSNRENILIGEAPPAQNASKQQCYRGHENWVQRTGPDDRTRRYCRTCRIEKEAMA